jgi:cobalt-precorrin 5A hydrolase
MKTAFLVLTPGGLELARRYREARPDGLAIFGPSSVVGDAAGPGVFGWEGPLRPLIPGFWKEYDAIIAAMAVGIVVRLVGALASNKRRDPAVVAVDDSGRFAISVLGGHGAGANALAEDLAQILGAQAVITTASEAGGLPAADRIGQDDGWIIERAENLTRVAAAVVRRLTVAVWQEAGRGDWWRQFGPWPANFHRVGSLEALRALKPEAVLFISDRAEPDGLPAGRTVVYRPPTLVAGIGCKRGTSSQVIAGWVGRVLAEQRLAHRSLAAIATVVLKIDEPGLLEFARSSHLPLVAFPAKQIANHPGIETPSEQVYARVGLWAVAEPSALRAAGASRLLVPKQKGPGVTLALARRPDDQCEYTVEIRSPGPNPGA